MSTWDVLLWGAAPYVVIAVLVVGSLWRWHYDRFGWTTRSSQLYESRLLRFASPLFHFGLLVVIVGHVIGLLVPESWTAALGVSEQLYHLVAVGLGALAGVCTLIGVALLIYRRRRNGPVFSATTVNDKAMYLVLVGAILLGLLTTVLANGVTEGYDYRATVSPWFRSIFVLQPEVALMVDVPWSFKAHVLVGMLLFALFPFTRLVHALSGFAAVRYLFRPYVVYRSRTAERARRGWEPVGVPGQREAGHDTPHRTRER
ncbi:nitrate reductase gamma subunit [Saccharopolyspora antimicrobica]|uniref:Nitrate reductase-like protein NarX n=1 Tax=Saccharopolyspora antimicrobica TaxID=455193 RepID=A0A1I5A2B6_9PSEU|nr:respiratory nitrate reductase subunit gamma [Saccharopolyspora antimicrobica]RKT83300.1 nitrate reductase gamma subunit [Saccharopolyspora antimicrobica]SFN56665.1 nitrate reductase gamma subunit [Saccharopolyspora antimicrobica]